MEASWPPFRAAACDTPGRPLPVKGYFAINERLPVFRTDCSAEGMIAVSREGRARFDRFPSMIADDLFLDSQFTAAERAGGPRRRGRGRSSSTTTRALVNRLVRVRRGNVEMRTASAEGEIEVAGRDFRQVGMAA